MCKTVGELIEKLKEFDPEMPLDITAFCYTGSDGNHWVEIVRSIWEVKDDEPVELDVEEFHHGKKPVCRISPSDSRKMMFND
jgi:hypothetical protein